MGDRPTEASLFEKAEDNIEELVSAPNKAVDEHEQQKEPGAASGLLPEGSNEVIETIDTSSASCRSPHEGLVIFNLDFEEMAQAMFGQIDLVDQIISGKMEDTSDPDNLMLSDISELDAGDEEATTVKNSVDIAELKSSAKKINEEKNKAGRKKEKTEINKKSREDRSVEYVLKTLNALGNAEEKLVALCKKYAELLEEHKVLQHTYKLSEKKNMQLIKEKEQMQAEHSKAILTRSRLESLCRELQRQNKVVKDESLMRVREEEEKRKEVSAKFQTTFNDITSMMQDSNQKSCKLREENIDLAQKLKTLIEQYELREQQVDKVVQHKELEIQLCEAKLAKANMLMNEEREQLLQEKHKCLQDVAEYQKRCHELTTNEVQLRSQLSLYTDKYEEFQSTLNKSNEVFSHFKKEMDQMSKKVKKLEKETGTWKSRWESSNKALVEMITEKQHRDAETINTAKKIAQLEKLCRALQTERQTHLAQLKQLKNASGVSSGTEEVQQSIEEPSPGIAPTASVENTDNIPSTNNSLCSDMASENLENGAPIVEAELTEISSIPVEACTRRSDRIEVKGEPKRIIPTTEIENANAGLEMNDAIEDKSGMVHAEEILKSSGKTELKHAKNRKKMNQGKNN